MIESDQFVEDEMSVAEYLAVLRRRRPTVVLTALAVLVVGCVATALMTPIYQAQAKLLVRAGAPQVSEVNTENPLADLLAMTEPETVDTQIEILRSQPFLEAAFRAAGYPLAGGQPTSVSRREPHPRRRFPPPRPGSQTPRPRRACGAPAQCGPNAPGHRRTVPAGPEPDPRG